MKKILSLILVISALFLSLNETLAYYNTSDTVNNSFSSKKYAISINANGGSFDNVEIVVKNNKTTLPTPARSGYTFSGYSIVDNGDVAYYTNINNVNELNGKKLYAKWNTITYSISYNLNGGSISSQPTNYNIEQTITLPTPTRNGYTFTGWTGTGVGSAKKNVTISNGIGDRSYTANWSKNYYTVNYYVNGNLWTQRSVGYGDTLENINAQSVLDIYHTFNGWDGWINNMPSNNVDLYANITESYCRLVTGHGPYGNASALLNVFRQAGWSGTIIEAPTAPGNYMVITDFNLTRAQAEVQKNYIASHTNYTNYNYPYLYWVAVECTNGYGEAWTRGRGQSSFN